MRRKKKANRNFISEMILSGIESSMYAFVNVPHSYAKPTKYFLDWIFEKNKVTKRQRYYIKRELDKMIAEKLVALSKAGKLELSGDGKKKLAHIRFNNFSLPRPNKWDGKFRVIIFDIPIGKNRIRMALRRQLEFWGFECLQHSVWVFPYECREVIDLVKEHFDVKADVVYITAESIENDLSLKRKFGLN